MITVFSNYLSPYIEQGLLPEVDQTKASEVYDQLSIAYNQGSEGVIHTTRLFVPFYEEQDPDEFDYDLYNVIQSNKDLLAIVTWFNSKIIPEMRQLSYRTVDVRMRIAISKIFKLVEEGKLDKRDAIKLHMNLAETIRNEVFCLVNEDLPF